MNKWQCNISKPEILWCLQCVTNSSSELHQVPLVTNQGPGDLSATLMCRIRGDKAASPFKQGQVDAC